MTAWELFLTLLLTSPLTGGVSIFLWRYVLVPAWAKCVVVYDFISDLDKLTGMLVEIDKELHPNGGTSLRDTIEASKELLLNAEARQVVAEQKYRAMLDSAGYGVFETNAQGEFTWTNSGFRRLVKREAEDLMGNGWINIVPPAERLVVFESWKDAIDQGRDYIDTINYLDLKTLGVIKLRVRAHKLLNTDGSIAGYFGTLRYEDPPPTSTS